MATINLEDIPSNSFSDKKKPKKKRSEEKPTITPINGKPLVQKKKTLSQKMASFFTGDDVTDVKSYLLNDVLVPAMRDGLSDLVAALSDGVRDGFDQMLFGSSARNPRVRRRNGYSGGGVNYNRFSNSGNSRNYSVSKNSTDPSDYIFNTRDLAEQVLTKMTDYLDTYDFVTISDFNDMVGKTGDYTDEKFGWDNLASARVDRIRDGYVIKFPPEKEMSD